MLVNNFKQFVNPLDYSEMKEKLNQLHSATDKFQKEALNQELEDTANKYGLLLNVFLFKIVANNAKTPQNAARANCAFDEMMQALNTGDIPAVRRIQSENEDLLNKEGGTLPGGITFSTALGNNTKS